MPHIHEKIDFTVSLFIVEGEKVLLVHHKKLDRWLPIGGHIELDEDPEQATRGSLREARRDQSTVPESVTCKQTTSRNGCWVFQQV